MRSGALRAKIGHERGFAETGWKPLWVLDFPMFEWDEEEKRWDALHHPFTAPADGHEDYARQSNRAAALSKALRHGAERLGDRRRLGAYSPSGGAVQVFAALNIGPGEARAKFGFLLDALQYGAPPHVAWPSDWIAS